MNILNDMNRTDDNEVKNIAAWNFLYGILNYSKSTKNINIHYYTILHGYINICGGKSRYNIFWILLDGVGNITWMTPLKVDDSIQPNMSTFLCTLSFECTTKL